MTLRAAYALGLGTTTALSLLAVLLGGELPVVTWVALVVPVLAGWRLARARPAGSLAVGTALALVGFGAGVVVVVGRGLEASVLGSAVALVGALAGRLYSRRELGHDLQALLLGLLLVFAGAGLHTQLTYGLVFAAFAVAAAWTLAARQLWAVAEREAARRGGTPLAVTLARRDLTTARFFGVTALAAVLVLLSTSVLFVVFPRVGLGTLGILSHRRGMLADGVNLSTAPRALGGGEVVARVMGVDYATFARGLYLRAAAYDQLSADGFRESPGSTPATRLPLAAAGRDRTYEVFVQPVTEKLLPALGAVHDVTILAGGGQGSLVRLSAMVWRTEGTAWASLPLTAPVRYRVWGPVASAADADRFLGAPPSDVPTGAADPTVLGFLALPSSIDRRIPALAAEVVGDARTPADKASRLRTWLTERFTYSLEQSNSGRRDPLASFLFDDRRGHCEFFATAFATLLRASGVPARVVGGFAGGVWDEGVVVFDASSAHAWTEWLEPGVGWVTDDATPVGRGGNRILTGLAILLERVSRAWDENVLEYGLDRQFALARTVGAAFNRSGPSTGFRIPWRELGYLAVALVVAGVATRVVRRRRHATRDAAERLGLALARACAPLLGREVRSSETLRGAVDQAGGRAAPAVAELLESALGRYERARFGAEPLAARELGAWISRLRRGRA